MENLDNFYSRAGGFARVLTGLLDRIIVRHLELGYAVGTDDVTGRVSQTLVAACRGL